MPVLLSLFYFRNKFAGLEWIGSYDLDKMALQLMVALTFKMRNGGYTSIQTVNLYKIGITSLEFSPQRAAIDNEDGNKPVFTRQLSRRLQPLNATLHFVLY